MLITNNGRYTAFEGRVYITSNRKDAPINIEDIDFEGGSKPPVDSPPEDKDTDTPIIENFEKIISNVENETIKSLDKDSVVKLFEEHKGVGFDKDGNILDVEGKIIKSFEDYKDSLVTKPDTELKEGDKVKIDDVEYVVDKEGNVLDAEGKVFKTKDELKTLLESNDNNDDSDDSYISQISSLTGFNAVDDDGNPIVFEDTVEDMAKRETHIVKQEANKLAQQELNSFFQENPDIVEMVNYKKLHGSLKDFGKSTDYSKITVEDNNDDQHRSIIIEAEMAQGKDEKRAKTIADMFIQDGKGKEEAEASLKYLKDSKEKSDKAAKEALEKREAQDKVEYENYVSEVVKVVKSGKAKEFNIPEFFTVDVNGKQQSIHRDAIFHVITEPIDDRGNTRYDLMKNNDTVEDIVLDAYMRLIGYDFGKLVKQKAQSDKIINLRTSKKDANNKVTIVKQNSSIDDSDLDFS